MYPNHDEGIGTQIETRAKRLASTRPAHCLAAVAFMASLPFRYGIQYAALGLAWLIGQVGEHRRPAVADELAPDAANPPIPARGTK